jgi:hypothetical protein
MPFTREALGWAAVTLLSMAWWEIERRLTPPTEAVSPTLRSVLPALVAEGLLLALFAGLWFGSLGSGGAALLFLVVGALVEIPVRLRSRSAGNLPWKSIVSGIARIVVAGLVLQAVMA